MKSGCVQPITYFLWPIVTDVNKELSKINEEMQKSK